MQLIESAVHAEADCTLFNKACDDDIDVILFTTLVIVSATLAARLGDLEPRHWTAEVAQYMLRQTASARQSWG